MTLTIEIKDKDKLASILAYLDNLGVSKIAVKVSKQGSLKKQTTLNLPTPNTKERDWSCSGTADFAGRLDNIENLRDYAYED
jgi:hypothetical protein